jgi:hypothetical protein
MTSDTPQLIRKALGYATIDGRIREAGRMNPSRKNATEPLWQTRRRYVWPAYSLIAAGILIMALNRAQSGWSLVGALVFGLAAFDLSISARIYGTQQRTLEAVIVWFGVGVVAFGACFSLFAWPT